MVGACKSTFTGMLNCPEEIVFVGFTGRTTVADNHSPLLGPWLRDGEIQSDDVMLWEYTAGNKTPALVSGRGRSDPNMESEDSHAYQKPVTRGEIFGNLAKLSTNYFLSEQEESKPITITRIIGSSVLLQPYMDITTLQITWRYLGLAYEQIILQSLSYSDIVAFSSYFKHRVTFNKETGSLLLRNLKIVDSGLYEMIAYQPTLNNEMARKHFFIFLDVQDKLRTPQITQNPAYILTHVQLSCIASKAAVSSIIWQKDNKFLNMMRVQLDFDNSTLFIQDMKVTDCGLYTCTVKNKVSRSSNSYFLTAEEILFIPNCALLMSVVALISSLTSIIAAAIIINALKHSQGQQKELTTIFVIFHLVSIICLLIASSLSVFGLDFSLSCRIIAGLGCFLSLAVIIYISILYLGLNTKQSPSFLLINYHCYIIFTCGILSGAASVVLIDETKKIVTACHYPYEILIIRSLLAAIAYIFSAFFFVLFYVAHLLEIDMRMKLRAVKRATRQQLSIM
ncbi:uncharacterized protein LOC121291357 [Carcharodon carcharias]|uniref:uncharacterized protein LOC121291357 n=1 Tax=Carcharodon carcharias TaxID=13397 RepID=UPI001B7EA477|nr:uncharacterized protein LOC121291357 [Carcharodon carcharias]